MYFLHIFEVGLLILRLKRWTGLLIKSNSVDQQVKQRFRPSEFSVIAPDTIPELKHVKQLLREIHKYLKLKKTLGLFNHV